MKMVASVRGRGRGNPRIGSDEDRRGRTAPRSSNVNGPFPPPLMGPRRFRPGGLLPMAPIVRGMSSRGLPHVSRGLPVPTIHRQPSGMSPQMPPSHPFNRPPMPFWGEPRRKCPFKGSCGVNAVNDRKVSSKLMDLSKPWVTNLIKSEFAKKDKLLVKAKESSNKGDWTSYRQQRDKCTGMYRVAEMEFIDQQEGMPNMNYFTEENDDKEYATDESEVDDYGELDECDEISTNLFTCDTCERNFPVRSSYEKHLSEHKTCGLDGCTFTAHEKLIENHINMQHSSGLYNKIRKLNTPEDIKKWVEDRRAKYPTKENVELRYKKQEELIKRGVKIGERNNKFGRDRTRLTRSNPEVRRQQKEKWIRSKKDKMNKEIKKFQPKSLIDEKADWNGNMFPFKGTKALYCMEDEKSQISDMEDEENWTTERNSDSFVKVNASLGALMGAYGSDISEDEKCEQKVEDINELKGEQNCKSDDEAPTEMKIGRGDSLQGNDNMEILGENPLNDTTDNKHKNCNRNRSVDNRQKGKRMKKKRYSDEFIYENFRKRRVTLLEKLLDGEIRKERNILLQCVKYVVDNNFLLEKVRAETK